MHCSFRNSPPKAAWRKSNNRRNLIQGRVECRRLLRAHELRSISRQKRSWLFAQIAKNEPGTVAMRLTRKGFQSARAAGIHEWHLVHSQNNDLRLAARAAHRVE